MEKIKELCKKYEEIIRYFIFGIITTVVALGSFFLILYVGKIFFHDANGEPTNALRLVANVLKWIFAVLVSFYTNKKWVFFDKEKDKKKVFKQLVNFSESRVLTLVLDLAVYFGMLWLLGLAQYNGIWLFTKDFVAKMTAEVIVVVANYFLSKIWIFKKPQKADSEENIDK